MRGRIMRDSFIFYRSFVEAISDLPESDQLDMYKAISFYSLDEKLPKLSGISKTIFNLIRPNIEANLRKYKNGIQGGRPKKKPKCNLDITKEEPRRNLDVTETKANVDVNEDEDVDVDVNEDDLLPSSTAKKRKHKSQVSEDFQPSDKVKNDLINKYPSLNIDNEIQAFIDFHISKGTLFSDSDRALRTWCRNAIKFNPPKKTKSMEEEDKSNAWVDEQIRISNL